MPDLHADLQSIGAALTSDTLEETLTNLVQGAVNAARANGGSLYLIDDDGHRLKPRIALGIADAYVSACGEIPLGTQCCGMAALHGKPWYVEDMLSDPLFEGIGEHCVAAGIRSGFSIPVIARDGTVLGSLACLFNDVRRPTVHEIERNRVFAALISFALAKEKRPVAA